MHCRRVSLALPLVLWLGLAPSLASAGPAADSFRTEHARLIDLVTQGASDADLGKQLDAMIDYGWLAEASLGGAANYATVCGARCAEFERLLTSLIRHNYLRMVRSADRHPVEIVDEVAGKGDVYKLSTRVSVQQNGRTRSVTVDYVLHEVDGRWQVRDIITDGISLVRTYRAEFNKLARSEGIDGIVTRLQDKLAADGA